MEKKYYLDKEDTIEFEGRTLYRIVALRDFKKVKKGDKGGYIEKESNLSHIDNCWVYHEAKVCDNARVREDAELHGMSVVMDSVELRHRAKMDYFSRASGNAKIIDNALMSGNACIKDNALMKHQSSLGDNAELSGTASMQEYATISENVKVKDIKISNTTSLYGDAVIESIDDFASFIDYWDDGDVYTWTRSNNKWSSFTFHGTKEELLAVIEKRKGNLELYKRYIDFINPD